MIKRTLEDEKIVHHQDSPGIIIDDEVVYRVLFISLHKDHASNDIKLSWFSTEDLSNFDRGSSINRKSFNGFSKSLSLAKNQIGTNNKKEDGEIRGAKVEKIRKILNNKDRVFIVIDDIILDQNSGNVLDVSHGNIFVLESIDIKKIGKSQFNKLRDILIDAFKDELYINLK